MVREIRQIIFQPSDVSAALAAYRETYPDFLPAGAIQVKGVAKDGALRIEVNMRYGRTEHCGVFDISGEDTLRVLISACSGLGVPIPKSGRKSLSGAPQGVTLMIQLEAGGNERGNEVALEKFAPARRLETG